jgi:hypothetical protein
VEVGFGLVGEAEAFKRFRQAPRRRGRGEGFAEKFLGEREVEERENQLQPLLAAEQAAEP